MMASSDLPRAPAMVRIDCWRRCFRWKMRRCRGVRFCSITCSQRSRMRRASTVSSLGASLLDSVDVDDSSMGSNRGRGRRKRRFTLLRVIPKIHTSSVDSPA